MCLTNHTSPTPDPPNNTANKSSTPTFHPFPHLPPELRFKIWSTYHALTGPRKLHFSYRHRSGNTYQPPRALEGNSSSHGFSSPRHEIPTLLHVCSESRSFALAVYSLVWLVPQSEALCGRGVRNALEEVGYEDVMRGREVRRGIFWDKKKDVMCIDEYWLDDNLRACLWGGRFDVKFPGVRWVVFEEGTTVGFVQDRAVGWGGVEVCFLVRGGRGVGSEMGKREERKSWERRFGCRDGEGEEEGGGMERGEMPELRIVESWTDVLEFLHRRGVW
ncbi:hypothetical protein NA56DRAFT_710962 [Hyaloscypha hepaticicola]|uniref:2EXR domain-containing protein n=1 Tax=Hyaloscypha hepaticicola TaxID=2082293 RepID=A0A2J6PK51_9HELO|nr:hypothetical protein NA56DRAFT_710962 [Hyaloscypha hepaticicola]